MGGSAPLPGRLNPWENPVPIMREAEWATGPVWTGGKISSPPGFDPGPSSPYSVAIPTELSSPRDTYIYIYIFLEKCYMLQITYSVIRLNTDLNFRVV